MKRNKERKERREKKRKEKKEKEYSSHLAFFEGWLNADARSHALPLWKTAGWVLGATAALFGPACVFRTIAAVETFVDDHYRVQIGRMRHDARLAELVAVLEQFREDEIAHRDDAAERGSTGDTWSARAWVALIGAGSSLGVAVARRV